MKLESLSLHISQVARDVFLLLEKVLVVTSKIHDSKSQKQLNCVCQ